jgi:hypothetical protein
VEKLPPSPGPGEGEENKGGEGPGQLLGRAGQAQDEAAEERALRPGQPHRAQEQGHEDEVVGPEDLLPVDQRVEGHEGGRGQPG